MKHQERGSIRHRSVKRHPESFYEAELRLIALERRYQRDAVRNPALSARWLRVSRALVAHENAH